MKARTPETEKIHRIVNIAAWAMKEVPDLETRTQIDAELTVLLSIKGQADRLTEKKYHLMDYALDLPEEEDVDHSSCEGAPDDIMIDHAEALGPIIDELEQSFHDLLTGLLIRVEALGYSDKKFRSYHDGRVEEALRLDLHWLS